MVAESGHLRMDGGVMSLGFAARGAVAVAVALDVARRAELEEDGGLSEVQISKEVVVSIIYSSAY